MAAQGASGRSDPLRVLEEVKRISVELLGAVPSGLFAPVEFTLHDSSQRGLSRPVELQALLKLRQQSAALVMRYRQQVAQGFDDFRSLRIRNRGDLPLSLVAENQLAFHLAGQQLADAIETRFAPALETMNARLDKLAEALQMQPGANPIGAGRLAGAFIETFRDAQMPNELQPLMFRAYEQELARVLGDLYTRVNQLLASAGFGTPVQGPRPLPPRDVQVARRDQEHDLVQEIRRPRAVDPRIAEQFAQLRTELHAWRQQLPGHAHAEALNALPRRELRGEELTSVVALLQPESPDVFVRALGGQPGQVAYAIREHLVDGARRLGHNPDHTRMSADQDDAIDLVGMLFESLFQSYALLDHARRLYGRLVMPYVKVALNDNALFVQREHPARKLLDAITEACEGNAAATPQDRELIERCAAISQRIVADYNEDLAVFGLAHAELEALLEQHRRRVELQEARAAKATFGRERLGEARTQADQVLHHLFAEPMTGPVGEFLAQPWRHHLVQTLLRDGAGSTRHSETLALGDALLDADRLARTGAEGRRLADRLLSLQDALTHCLASSGLDEEAAMQRLSELVRALALPDAPRDVPAAPAAVIDEEAATEDASLWLAGGTATVAHDPEVAARMRRLLPGEWLRLLDPAGQAVAVKVAWISPMTGRFLLVNRRGLRVLVASATELAALAQAGRLQVGAERAPTDEAIRHLRDRLTRAAA
ncbi:DUF1631 family protein [Lysobacter solisilvae (ex Woo and Kim 2020)]|uniref:DUF1631 family protein n=1 Tax=Agrilutibacter terrestris TaxID=2865112 RepID=A0A7H0FUZ7_9GAMM|nr:DUF1631 family protein [Lysobacter terrestris]QNP39863.1 DUF1631 family protein [Lysobacter terrestris]